MKFTKMHGCGNDYVYVNGFNEKLNNASEKAKFVSNRHFGIGADGMIVIEPSKKADFEMVMYNADGSRGEMCGNGIRCVAKYVYDHKMTDKTNLKIESMGEVKSLDLTVQDGEVSFVRVDMGVPILKAKEIPVICSTEEALNLKLNVLDKDYLLTCVSMGNPHAVTFVDDVQNLDLEKIGPFFENNKIFPKRINTEFAKIIDRDNIEMRVWERGSGETLACGTGSCATAVAAILKGLANNKVTLHLLGGNLIIEWSGNLSDSVYMTGPATTVFDGEIDL